MISLITPPGGGVTEVIYMMFFGFLIFLVLIVFLIKPEYIRNFLANREPAEKASRAEEVLKKRYVKGEIDEEEYLRKLKILRGGE